MLRTLRVFGRPKNCRQTADCRESRGQGCHKPHESLGEEQFSVQAGLAGLRRPPRGGAALLAQGKRSLWGADGEGVAGGSPGFGVSSRDLVVKRGPSGGQLSSRHPTRLCLSSGQVAVDSPAINVLRHCP